MLMSEGLGSHHDRSYPAMLFAMRTVAPRTFDESFGESNCFCRGELDTDPKIEATGFQDSHRY